MCRQFVCGVGEGILGDILTIMNFFNENVGDRQAPCKTPVDPLIQGRKPIDHLLSNTVKTPITSA